jgi:hypothetical protein
MLVIDQGNQYKNIVAVTILHYNRTTVFGIDTNGKKTWLGKYDSPEHTEIIARDINRAIKNNVECYTMP